MALAVFTPAASGAQRRPGGRQIPVHVSVTTEPLVDPQPSGEAFIAQIPTTPTRDLINSGVPSLPRVLNPPVPPPPGDDWLQTPEQPGFEFQARITPPFGPVILGARETDCIAETLCIAGALPGRPELFAKIIGPRPNGFLWVQISRFTPSGVEVWVRQIGTGEVNYYSLDPVGRSSELVCGFQDREAFQP